MIEPPALTFTKVAPTIEAMIETPPSTNGYSTACGPVSASVRLPSNIVAMTVTA